MQHECKNAVKRIMSNSVTCMHCSVGTHPYQERGEVLWMSLGSAANLLCSGFADCGSRPSCKSGRPSRYRATKYSLKGQQSGGMLKALLKSGQ